MRSDLIRLWLTLALAIVLAIATVAYYSNPAPAPVVAAQTPGEIHFLSKGCTGCHSMQGLATSGQIGPDLTFVADVAGERVKGLTAEEYIAQSLAEPHAFVVPGFSAATSGAMPDLNLSDSEIAALVEFLLGSR